jgi:lipopolysaccharide heptosyltransferase II
LDRESLIRRNQAMAQAFHTTSLKHRLRRGILHLAANIPIPPPRKTNHQRILLIRPDHLGDVLLTSPTIRALKAARPDLEVHMLVGPWSADVIAAYPEIDQILTLAFPGFSRTAKENWRSPYQTALNAARHLRRIGYSSAVILRPDHWWGGLVAKLAGIPERVGYNLSDVAPYLTQAIALQRKHVVEQNLRLVEQWTGTLEHERIRYDFPVDPIDAASMNGYLQKKGVSPEQPLFCIHPGSGTWVKHWQEEKWAQVADTLTEQIGAQVVFSGGAHEAPLIRRIVDLMKQPAILTAGETAIGTLAALFQRAKVVLGPDSGPLHLAVATGTPTVTLFGPADPLEFGPWGDAKKHIVLTSDIACRPCRVLDWDDDDPAYHPCLREISIGRVLDAARRVVSKR